MPWDKHDRRKGEISELRHEIAGVKESVCDLVKAWEAIGGFIKVMKVISAIILALASLLGGLYALFG